MKLLFCSYHCYFDPSSGAALATRDLLELLVERGWQCQVLCGPQLDFEEGESLPQLLTDHQLHFEVRHCDAGPVPFALFCFMQGGVSVTIYWPAVIHRPQPPPVEGYPFLALFERLVERFCPDLLLTYGGHRLARELIACAKNRGLPVIFAVHNLAYDEAEFFRPVDAVFVPSRFAQAHYQRTLGLACTAIPGPWNWARVRCAETHGQYLTFVNPQPTKGVFFFVRIATELGRLRPDIPLLVVEGRGKAGWLSRTGHDLRNLRNLYAMANTPDPRDFYRVSRLVLMPSLCRESFPRVAAEALINGIPVLGSRRGGLPEVLEQAGFLFDVPEGYAPESSLVPTPEEVAPWVETIVRLWDDAALYDRERQRCRMAAEACRPERLGPVFQEFFACVLHQSSGGRR